MKPNEINLPEPQMDKEIFARQSLSWLVDNGIMTDVQINQMVLMCYVVSDSIKNVEMFINKDEKTIEVIVYISRFAYLFKNRKKIMDDVVDSLKSTLQGKFNLNVEIKLFRNS